MEPNCWNGFPTKVGTNLTGKPIDSSVIEQHNISLDPLLSIEDERINAYVPVLEASWKKDIGRYDTFKDFLTEVLALPQVTLFWVYEDSCLAGVFGFTRNELSDVPEIILFLSEEYSKQSTFNVLYHNAAQLFNDLDIPLDANVKWQNITALHNHRQLFAKNGELFYDKSEETVEHKYRLRDINVNPELVQDSIQKVLLAYKEQLNSLHNKFAA